MPESPLTLRPATLAALDAFRARRTSLLQKRAFLCALAIALAAIAVIALLDFAWLMPDIVRPWVTLAAYLAAIIAAWKIALRFISQAKGQEGAAKLIEAAEPSLRERLLAAVELSANGEVKDSAEFRERLQDDVAKAVEGVDWDKRLPSRSLKPWFLAAFGVVAVVVGLCFVPMLHFPGFLARAAVPFANFERPASLKITIVEPAPASTLAPIGSEMPLIIETEGAKAPAATLEVLAPGGRPRKIELSAFGTTRFEGIVPVGQTDVQYRVHAADAITPWHTLSARARPRIVSFQKTIVPPSYTGAKETTITEDQGDLEALDGSTIKLTLTANQPISKAEVHLNAELAEKKSITAELAVNTVTTVIKVTPEASSWLAALKSAETGFTNEETTPWRITTIPDLPPTAQIEDPAQQIELLPDEAVRLAGLATDDVGLASVKLAHTINAAKWSETDLLITKAAKEAPVTHLLPLAPLGVKAGDAVQLKLIATDLKGQKTESPAVRVIILERTIDPRQREWAESQRRLAQRAESLAKQTRELTKSLDQVRKQEKKDPAQADTALAKAQSELEQVKEQSEQLWNDLKDAAKNAPNQLDANEAQLLAEKMAQLRREALPKLEALEKGDTENLEALKKASRVADADADAVASAAKAFANEDTAKIAAQESQQLMRQSKMLTENALPANRDANQRPQWQEQQRALIAQTEALKKDLTTLDETSRQRHSGQIKNLDKQLNETAADLNASLDKPDQTKSPEHLYGASDNLRNRLQQTADATRNIAEQASKEAEQRREQLMRQDNPALVALNEARQALAEAEAAAKKPDKKPKQEKDGLTPAERAQQKLAEASKQLQDQAEIREQNQLTNNQAALDTNRASRAVDEVAQNAQKAATAEELAQVKEQTEKLANIARALEADAAVQDAAQALQAAQQAAMQPANKQDLPQTAAQAKAAAETLAEAQQQINRSQLAAEMNKQNPQAANQLRQLGEEAKNLAKNAAEQNKNLANQAAQAQPNQNLDQNPAQQSTAQAAMKANELAALIEPQTAAARAQLAELTPEVSEMMKRVAADLKKTQEQTQNAANEAKAEKPVAEVADKAKDLKAENAENTEKMAALQAALRQEANAADLTQKPEMQMARAADVALAQMQKNTPQIAQNLKQAAQATQSQPQAQNLQQAADAQQQAAQALQQLAQNMQKLEDGQQLTEAEQAAMANMEQQLGVQEPLDESYQRAQELAQMAQDAKENPQAVLAALEKELPKNPAMQKALADLGKETAQQSEAAVAKESQQLSNTGMATLEAANNLKRVARHQDRLGDKPAAQATAEAAKQVEAAGKQAQATQANPQPNPQMAQQAQANAAQAAKSAEATASKTAPPLFTSPLAQMQGQMLAQALDQLDAQLNPAQTQSGQQSQSGQQQQAGQQQGQQAQNSLNQAQQAQQQQMADSRNSGQTPGQQPSPQQMAQNQQQSQQNGAQSNEGGNKSQLVKAEGELGTITVLVPGDWGHLPQKMADDLTEATRTEAAPEYRAAIESYYKAIAQKAKK
ncbi:MAG: hypothetical protein JNN17_13295 [Verrucomicrobiaceae bacterium]|nr:hypothetical protein [Verrucomicrobiaceae bacterium]